jgi:molybdenum cofactor biosynthesis enzyme MoaA
MHFQTFSIVVGTRACNASCPFCISKQTGFFGTPPKVNWRNFHIACRLAQKADTTTVLLTGKGEPTLYPNNVTETLKGLQEYKFPMIEMQTNGLRMADDSEEIQAYLERWYDLGLTTIAISVVHYDQAKNAEIYTPDGKHYDLAKLIAKLHKIGFSVRLCVMLVHGYIDSYEKVQTLIAFAKANKVEQLTLRPITPSEVTESPAVTEWTSKHTLGMALLNTIVTPFKAKATLLQHLMHGMDVYDYDGQNVCLGNCLTRDAANQKDEFRSLIFFPEGSLYWDWQYKGARIL